MGETESIAGRVLAEKYLLIERLGEGGFGSIWRAEHQVLKSPIAVKLIDLEMARREGAVERFLREAQATAALRSPHVVQILDYGLDRRIVNDVECEQPFIVMELLEGENLADRIARLGPLSPLDVVRVVTHVARAMSRAHELGIVHRDLKPANIFLVSNGDEEVAKVLDFGVAKIASPMDLNRDTYTQTGSLVGTPYYMSPEQAQGNKTVDHRSDLWALGVIAFEMLIGRRPFDSEALGDLVLCICVREIPVPSHFGPVPSGFDAWFARAVARDPDHRFQSARELALALLELVENSEGEVRYTQFDEQRGVRALASRIEARSGDAALAVDIPSRPFHSPFAATVRDNTLAQVVAAGATTTPQPVEPQVPDAEARLAPWALFGMALLALAAGAAAVYGLFHLLRDPDPIDHASLLDPSATADERLRAFSPDPTKRRSAVSATHRQPQNPSTGPTQNTAGKAPRGNDKPADSPRSIASSDSAAAPTAKGPGPAARPAAIDARAREPQAASSQGAGPSESQTPNAGVPANSPSAETVSPGAGASGFADSAKPTSKPIDALPMVTDPN